ncbi:hypothetical protein [Nocardia sp. NPDC003979]
MSGDSRLSNRQSSVERLVGGVLIPESRKFLRKSSARGAARDEPVANRQEGESTPALNALGAASADRWTHRQSIGHRRQRVGVLLEEGLDMA